MAPEDDLTPRFALVYDTESSRRIVAGLEVIIHCHHYNCRIQATIEGAANIDGKTIISSSAEAIADAHIRAASRPGDDPATRFRLAAALYAHLGFGRLDLTGIDDGIVTASASHFVEGWNAAFPERATPVCTFTEGYIQAALHAIKGETAYAREEQCMISGARECRFRIVRDRREPFTRSDKQPIAFAPKRGEGFVRSPNIDEQAILRALVDMPIRGDAEGLIPAFGVYLANTPADFYNLVCIRFVEEMTKQNLFKAARKLLVHDAETCAMNTFRGIMSSAEWDGLIAPMLKEPSDGFFAMVAISNAMGWGNWHVREHTPGASVTLESLYGYEALGYRSLRGRSDVPRCFVLTGLAAGMMELYYGHGSIEERFGTFASTEAGCICMDEPSCTIEAKKI
jgi:hypothetical protein